MGRLVPAVTRALDILELFLDGDGTLSAPEITRRLQLPRTTVHELVTTLAARHYLVPLPGQPGRYRLGVRPYQLGSRYAEQLDLAAEGRQVARSVAETCDETVHVAILEGTDVIYIAKVDTTHAVRMVSAAGRRLPAHCTSVGKMLLASLPGDGARRAAARTAPLAAMTPNSITTRPPNCARPRRDPASGASPSSTGSPTRTSAAWPRPVRDRAGQVVAALSHLRADDPLERGAPGRAGGAGGQGRGGAVRAAGAPGRCMTATRSNVGTGGHGGRLGEGPPGTRRRAADLGGHPRLPGPHLRPGRPARRTVMATEQHVGAAKPRAGGGLVVNLRDGVGLYDARRRASAGCTASPSPGGAATTRPSTPRRRAVGGHHALRRGAGRRHAVPGRRRTARSMPVLDDVTVSNGTGWSPDGRLMYYVDTPDPPRRRLRRRPRHRTRARAAAVRGGRGGGRGAGRADRGRRRLRLGGPVGRRGGPPLHARGASWTGRSNCRCAGPRPAPSAALT